MADKAPGVVEIQGLAELRRDMIRLGDDEMPKAFIEAGRKVAEPLASQIRSALPDESGDLAGTVRVAKVRTGAALRVGTGRIPYAPWVEFGGTRRRPWTSSRPYIATGRYIFPAARAAGPAAVEQYVAEVQKIMDRFPWHQAT